MKYWVRKVVVLARVVNTTDAVDSAQIFHSRLKSLAELFVYGLRS